MSFERNAIVIAGLFAFACGHELPQQPMPVSVRAATTIVQRATVSSTRTVAGIARSASVSPLAAKVVGNVVRVYVSEGDFVKAGQLLVEIDAREGRAQRDAAQSAIAAASANAGLAETTYKRYAALRERHSVSQQELDNVDAQVKGARAELERARANAAQAQTFLDYSAVRAPFDGVVTARYVDPGAQAAPGMPLVTIEDPRAVRVETSVPEELQMRAGDRVLVDGVEGRVTHVQPSIDAASRTSLVKIDVSKPLRSGTFVRVAIPTGKRDALTVPPGAIVRRGTLTSVFVVGSGGIARMRLITLGDANEVLSGLEPGERIVTEPAKVTDGTPVSPLPAARGEGKGEGRPLTPALSPRSGERGEDVRRGTLTSVFVVGAGGARMRLITLGDANEVLSGLEPAKVTDGTPVSPLPAARGEGKGEGQPLTPALSPRSGERGEAA